MSITKPENVLRSNLFPSVTASGFGQFSVYPYHLSSNDEEYLTPKSVAEITPWQRDPAARWITPERLYSNSPPAVPTNWGEVNPSLDDFHSERMEISGTFWLPNISDRWPQPEKSQWNHASLSKVAGNIFSIIPCGITAEASVSHGLDIIGWRQSNTTDEML